MRKVVEDTQLINRIMAIQVSPLAAAETRCSALEILETHWPEHVACCNICNDGFGQVVPVRVSMTGRLEGRHTVETCRHVFCEYVASRLALPLIYLSEQSVRV